MHGIEVKFAVNTSKESLLIFCDCYVRKAIKPVGSRNVGIGQKTTREMKKIEKQGHLDKWKVHNLTTLLSKNSMTGKCLRNHVKTGPPA